MIELARPGTRWHCPDPARKLAARARLPGAFSFDRAAVGVRSARQAKVPLRELLPLAFASSWLVNNAAPSPLFQRWLKPPAIDVWAELVGAHPIDAAAWQTAGATERQHVHQAVTTLADGPHGAGALSKILALLVPDLMPLMPDAALWFGLGTIARPTAPDAQTADATYILPMLDWFARATVENEAELRSIAEAHADVALSPAQVLDRLVWFDSVGYRHFRGPSGAGWFWVQQGDRQAVVSLTSAPTSSEEPVDLDAAPEAAWRDEAMRALDVDSSAQP